MQALAVCLSAIAGYVDAVGFLATGGYFVSFMSGNSTRFAVGTARATASAGIAAGLIGGFVLGVVLGSLSGTLAGAHRRSAVLILVGALLAGAATFGAIGVNIVVIGLTALAMGAENAAFEQPGGGSVGLTYMTGTLAKIGQGIAVMLIGRAGSSGSRMWRCGSGSSLARSSARRFIPWSAWAPYGFPPASRSFLPSRRDDCVSDR